MIIGQSSPRGAFSSVVHADYLGQEIRNAIDAP